VQWAPFNVVASYQSLQTHKQTFIDTLDDNNSVSVSTNDEAFVFPLATVVGAF
jgi:hypothetical protein